MISLSCEMRYIVLYVLYIYDFKELYRNIKKKIYIKYLFQRQHVNNGWERIQNLIFINYNPDSRCHRLKKILPFFLPPFCIFFVSISLPPLVINMLILFRDSWLVKRVRHVNQSELIIMFFVEQGSLLR